MPEHGTWARYQRGCRRGCCTTAARNYQKRRVYDAQHGLPRKVSSAPTRRRMEALGALGWTSYDLAARLGQTREWARQVAMRDTIWRSTAERVATLYDAMCMTLPPTDTRGRRIAVARQLNRARRLGWLPPLAWEDIEAGVLADDSEADSEADSALVDRILGGEWRLPATPADRAAVIERWRGSNAELARLTGWNVCRLIREGAAA